MVWTAGEEGGKKEQNRLEKARLGRGLMRFGEQGAQGQEFQEQTHREHLEKCKGLQVNQLVRSEDLVMMMMMSAATLYGTITISHQPVGRALHKHCQISSSK